MYLDIIKEMIRMLSIKESEAGVWGHYNDQRAWRHVWGRNMIVIILLNKNIGKGIIKIEYIG